MARWVAFCAVEAVADFWITAQAASAPVTDMKAVMSRAAA
jgi:hypothetical protein